MDLNDIEGRAEGLALDLADATSVSQAGLLQTQLQGLKDLALIKSVRYSRDAGERGSQTRTAAQPVAVRCKSFRSGVVFNSKPTQEIRLQCVFSENHPGLHRDREGVRWDSDPEPTKPAVDRLHELVSYARECGQQYAAESRVTDDPKAIISFDFAEKLEEILLEGGL
jgi:hypothetical protein